VTAPTRRCFYPAEHYEHWAKDFWAILRALQEDDAVADQVNDQALAVVAALLMVVNKVDDLYRD
jgi:G:T/U-mismatch repair DNA glycosylase